MELIMNITREIFDEQRRPRFGVSNPERMNLAFWEWMIRGDDEKPPEDDSLLGKMGLITREGILKSSYGPYRARDLFQVPLDRGAGPIWTFDRMGQTKTELPDGRIVCIAGEHEDSYDPDFYIYNDVVVLGPNDEVEIYGYPKDVFPPTDFHTATLVGNSIIIIGCIGYFEQRLPGHTPVYSLNLQDYTISELKTTGEKPGWILRHEAELRDDDTIRIKDGEIQIKKDKAYPFLRNSEEYSLDLKTGVWSRLTDRRPFQLCIRRQDRGWFPTERRIDVNQFFSDLTEIAEFLETNSDDDRDAVFNFQESWIRVIIGFHQIEVMADASISLNEVTKFVDLVRVNLEEAIGFPCESLHLAGGA